ncbi:MAG TPA: hypothetical protein VGG74_12615 [Kofleriaceae bacterium]|jgi:hypothetical protein
MRSLRPSWLVLAVVLPACMRGCDSGCTAGSPPVTCHDSSDCPAHSSCRRGDCVDESYARIDDDCRASVACAQRGACTAVRRRSFLGLDPNLECAATTDDDCRRSELCRTRGLCSRGPYDVGCAATDAGMCRASERCASREECDLESNECVRHWTGCPALAEPGAPAWAVPARLVWDYDDSLRAPWQPGDVEHATLACSLVGNGAAPTSIRVAGHCTAGPQLDRSGTGKWLRADIALRSGDAIALSALSGVSGHASGAAFAQLRYNGSSPALGGSGDEAIECVVVPHAVALERSRRELAAVDRDIAQASHEQVDLSARGGELSSAIEDARVHAERAAQWLGWSAAELVLRVVRLDAQAHAWQLRLDEAIRKLAVTDKPVRGDHMTVTRTGRVCGDALRARLGAAATTCALELAIDNTGPSSLSISPIGNRLDELDDLTWLRPAHDSVTAEVAPATVIEIRVGTTTTTQDAVDVPSGKRALVLIGGGTPGALLHGRIGMRETFALRW